MPTMADIEKTLSGSNERTNCIVYGPPKVGKTLAVGRLAEAGFTLHVFDLDNGWEVFKRLTSEAKSRINLYRIPDTRGNPCGIEAMMRIIKGSKMFLCAEHGKAGPVPCPTCAKAGAEVWEIELNKLGPTDIVVIDTGTQLGESAISEACKGMADDYQMQIQDWGCVGKYLTAVISYIRPAKFHCIVTAHELSITDEVTKQTKIYPQIGTGNYSEKVGGAFAHIVHFEIKNRKHTGASSTTYQSGLMAGSRTDVQVEKDPELSLLPIFAPWLPK